MLAQALESAQVGDLSPREALARHAREFGSALAERSTPATDPVDILTEAGFEPFDDDGSVRLANCPFHRLARAHTELVCGMNLHLLQGMLAALPGAAYTAELDPGPDRCCVVLNPG